MEHIFDNLEISTITDSASSFFITFMPVVSLVVGILLAFLIIKVMLSFIQGRKHSFNNDGFDYPSDDDMPEEDFDDEEE